MQWSGESTVIAESFAALTPLARELVVQQFAAFTFALAESAVDLRPRLWRLLQATFPEQQAHWSVVAATEGLAEVELEEEIRSAYEQLFEDPDDDEALQQLRALQTRHAVILEERFNSTLPVERGEIAELLNRARETLK
jgi:hypothetical protein